uniref:Uncharacterized protein n=1 Tax=Cacopsylla melanoneura TaxID=428564 RepID=A0A8D8W6B4_9HEMI
MDPVVEEEEEVLVEVLRVREITIRPTTQTVTIRTPPTLQTTRARTPTTPPISIATVTIATKPVRATHQARRTTHWRAAFIQARVTSVGRERRACARANR